MAKKIKSFTADEDVYNNLVTMFKKHGATASISMYLNNRLKWLLEHLEDLEDGLQKSKGYNVPMSYIIDETVKLSGRSGRIPTSYDEEIQPYTALDMNLMMWDDAYEADKIDVPHEFYEFYKSGNYLLSKDKKFLVDKASGKKFIARNGALIEVREVETKD